MPIWLKQNDWRVKFQFKNSTLFKNDLGLETFKKSKFKIIISSSSFLMDKVRNRILYEKPDAQKSLKSDFIFHDWECMRARHHDGV